MSAAPPRQVVLVIPPLPAVPGDLVMVDPSLLRGFPTAHVLAILAFSMMALLAAPALRWQISDDPESNLLQLCLIMYGGAFAQVCAFTRWWSTNLVEVSSRTMVVIYVCFFELLALVLISI